MTGRFVRFEYLDGPDEVWIVWRHTCAQHRDFEETAYFSARRNSSPIGHMLSCRCAPQVPPVLWHQYTHGSELERRLLCVRTSRRRQEAEEAETAGVVERVRQEQG